MHPSQHVDTPMRHLRRREAIKMHPPLFYSPCSRWHTCAGRWVVGVQRKRICKHSCLSNTCLHGHTHTHIHKAVNRRPIISHLFLTSSQLDRRLTVGHWGSGWVSHLQRHTHAHTLVIFILASVSFHPATQFHLSALLHIILSLF